MGARDSHPYAPHLYQLWGDDLTLFKIARRQQVNSTTLYTSVPYECNLINNHDFFPLDIHISPNGIFSLGCFSIPLTHYMPATISSLEDAFTSLPSALCRICGEVKFPPDNGNF